MLCSMPTAAGIFPPRVRIRFNPHPLMNVQRQEKEQFNDHGWQRACNTVHYNLEQEVG